MKDDRDYTKVFTYADVKVFMQQLELWRTAGGREEHHARKEALQNYVEFIMDGSNHWKALAKLRKFENVDTEALSKENLRLKLKIAEMHALIDMLKDDYE